MKRGIDEEIGERGSVTGSMKEDGKKAKGEESTKVALENTKVATPEISPPPALSPESGSSAQKKNPKVCIIFSSEVINCVEFLAQ